jgi:opacity protein-like surface antigen
VRFWLAFAVLHLAAGVPVARAAEAGEYRLAVTPLIGYRMGGDFEAEDSEDEVELDDDGMVALAFNVPYQSVDGEAYTEWELYLSRQSAGIDSAPAGVDPALDVDITHVLLGGNYVGAGTIARPFLTAGIGAAHISPDGPGYGSDTVFAFGIGGGAQLYPANRVGLRLEARLLGSVVDSDSSIFCASGSGGATCAFRASGDVLWQWDVSAGVVVRF